MSAEIQPIIQTPGHGALPSGHATEAFATARMLVALHHAATPSPTPKKPRTPVKVEEMLMALAGRIAVNRTIAGVHFPADSMAGATLGLLLGEYFALRAGTNEKVSLTKFNGRLVHAHDFEHRDFWNSSGRRSVNKGSGKIVDVGKTSANIDQVSSPLKWLWDEAKKEF